MALQRNVFKCVTADNVYTVNSMTCVCHPGSHTHLKLKKNVVLGFGFILCCLFFFFFYLKRPSLQTSSSIKSGDAHCLWSDKWPINSRAGFRASNQYRHWSMVSTAILVLIGVHRQRLHKNSDISALCGYPISAGGHCPSSVSPTNQLVT